MIPRAETVPVLVTGGTGFVGSHLVERLLGLGHPVTCLVRDPDRPRWLAGLPVRLVKGDCTDPATLPPAVEGASVVFHLAGLTKALHARDYYKVNHQGTKNLIEACAPHAPRFILASSLSAAGPSPDGRPVTDADPPRPVSDYGKSKLLAEREALSFKDRLPVVVLRPSAVYGPRDTDVFELFRWAARGILIDLRGGERYINPCFVDDLVEALVLAAQKDARSGSVYFVAEEREYAMSEFLDLVLATGGLKARRIMVPYGIAWLSGLATETAGLLTGKAAVTNRQKLREAAQKHWLCDTGKIRRELGFTARYSLNKGLEVAWKWYRENGWL